MSIFKIKKLFFLSLFSLLMPVAAFGGNLILKSFGHSSFLIKGDGQTILLNPYDTVGCASHLSKPWNLRFDFILASSRLADEGYNPLNKLMFVDPGSYQFNETIFNGIAVPHDRFEGRRYGMATVWVWEQNNLKIVHMGGSAGELNFNNKILLASPDILFISVGGGEKSYHGQEAAEIVNELNPKIVIPVHYLGDKQNNPSCEFSNADEFLANLSDYEVEYVGKRFTINPNKVDDKVIYIIK